MIILIACDERSSKEKLYSDLMRAGLATGTEVYVLSVANVFVPPGCRLVEPTDSLDEAYEKYIDRDLEKAYQDYVAQEIKKAEHIANDMTAKLQAKFPQWDFYAKATAGSPAWEIVKKAKEWNVDLIVVGSHGKMGVGGFLLGNVAMNVLSQAHCSVRVVRSTVEDNDMPSRIIIGIDGSPDSEMAINSIVARKWEAGSIAHLITSTNSAPYIAFRSDDNVGELQTQDGKLEASIQKMHSKYRSKLEKAGLCGSSLIAQGDPKAILQEEALDRRADCIFVGAQGHSKLDRLIIGSVSAAIAAQAPCSVEVVRNYAPQNKGVRDETKENTYSRR